MTIELIGTNYIQGASRSINVSGGKKNDYVVVFVSLNAAGANDPYLTSDYTKIGTRVGNGVYLYYKKLTSDGSFSIISGLSTNYTSFELRYWILRGVETLEESIDYPLPKLTTTSYTKIFTETKHAVLITGNGNSGYLYKDYESVNSITETLKSWGSNTIPILIFSAKAPVELKLLIKDNEGIKTYNNGWSLIGSEPVTENMFLNSGINNLSIIPENQWNQLKQDIKILTYTQTVKTFLADIKIGKLFDINSNLYYGTGIIESEVEKLPTGRKQLIINADHQNCTFEFSLDDGTTWYSTDVGEVKDITTIEGNLLKVRVTLPDSTTTITSISYAWA